MANLYQDQDQDSYVAQSVAEKEKRLKEDDQKATWLLEQLSPYGLTVAGQWMRDLNAGRPLTALSSPYLNTGEVRVRGDLVEVLVAPYQGAEVTELANKASHSGRIWQAVPVIPEHRRVRISTPPGTPHLYGLCSLMRDDFDLISNTPQALPVRRRGSGVSGITLALETKGPEEAMVENSGRSQQEHNNEPWSGSSRNPQERSQRTSNVPRHSNARDSKNPSAANSGPADTASAIATAPIPMPAVKEYTFRTNSARLTSAGVDNAPDTAVLIKLAIKTPTTEIPLNQIPTARGAGSTITHTPKRSRHTTTKKVRFAETSKSDIPTSKAPKAIKTDAATQDVSETPRIEHQSDERPGKSSENPSFQLKNADYFGHPMWRS